MLLFTWMWFGCVSRDVFAASLNWLCDGSEYFEKIALHCLENIVVFWSYYGTLNCRFVFRIYLQ
jgi:hypothetical protein